VHRLRREKINLFVSDIADVPCAVPRMKVWTNEGTDDIDIVERMFGVPLLMYGPNALEMRESSPQTSIE
jgi:hypothetical protein